MTRTSKTPRYNAFNIAPNAFGRFSTDPKKWREYLDPSKSLILELGCGKAEVSLGLAAKHGDENYVGVDLKADRLWRASKDALGAKLTNVAFVQSDILLLLDYFEPSTVATIWITFPDPFPKKRQAKHRMLNRNFLDIYKTLLKKEGVVKFKTDNQALFDWALELLQEQKDLGVNIVTLNTHESHTAEDDVHIQTTYERKFQKQGITTKYLEFSFR